MYNQVANEICTQIFGDMNLELYAVKQKTNFDRPVPEPMADL